MLRETLLWSSMIMCLFAVAQDFDTAKFLDGQWCDADEIECFKISLTDGLLIYETLTGDFRAGVEIVNYDKNTKTIYWQIIRTAKRTNHFKILGKNIVEYDNNGRRVLMYRKKE